MSGNPDHLELLAWPSVAHWPISVTSLASEKLCDPYGSVVITQEVLRDPETVNHICPEALLEEEKYET